MMDFLKKPFVATGLVLIGVGVVAYFLFKYLVGGGLKDAATGAVGAVTAGTKAAWGAVQQGVSTVTDAIASSTHTIAGTSTNNPAQITQGEETAGLFDFSGGSRSLSDATSHPLDFLAFEFTGDSQYLEN